MDPDEDDSSIAELMDAVLNLHNKDYVVLGLAFGYFPIESLKTCRLVNKVFHEAATKCLVSRSRIRLDNATSFLSYVQQAPAMQTAWESFTITVAKQSANLLAQFGKQYGTNIKSLELNIRHRETKLTYLEDLFSEMLPNLEELILKGKFPATAMFRNPQRMVGKMGKVKVFNLVAKGWHRLAPLATGEVTFKSPVIGELLAAMPNLDRIIYFPDVDSPRDAHNHHSSFLFNLIGNEDVTLKKLSEIERFPISSIDAPSLKKFASKGFPLKKLHVLVEEEMQPEVLRLFLETFKTTLIHLVIQSATENPINWPRLLKLEELTLVGVNIEGTNLLTNFPTLKTLHISQDRVTSVDLSPERALFSPHTLSCLKIIETVAVNSACRLSDNGLRIIFRDLPFLSELAIVQHIDSNQPTFTDEAITGSELSVTTTELSVRPRDLRIVNMNLMRGSHFIGNLTELQKLTLKAPSIGDISLLCGIITCHKINNLNISSPRISEKACVEMLDYINVSKLRIQDFGEFTSSGKSEILMRMKFQNVFYASSNCPR